MQEVWSQAPLCWNLISFRMLAMEGVTPSSDLRLVTAMFTVALGEDPFLAQTGAARSRNRARPAVTGLVRMSQNGSRKHASADGLYCPTEVRQLCRKVPNLG